ncbi:MAG: hypothetical protein RL670_923 [Actinomycetota bacterium]
MALSDRERKVLEELERDLYASDANFARKIDRPAIKSAKLLVGGSALALVGISVTIFAVIIQVFWFGLLGFILLLAGLVLASSNWSDRPVDSGAKPREPKPNFFEDRWNRRQGE